jgi:hypothetical protein
MKLHRGRCGRYFFVLLRVVVERVAFARAAFGRAVLVRAVEPRAAAPRAELRRVLVASAVSAAVALFAAALPVALAALPAAPAAALASLTIRPAARLACPASCSAFFLWRVAAAFFAAADLCAFVWAITLLSIEMRSASLYASDPQMRRERKYGDNVAL